MCEFCENGEPVTAYVGTLVVHSQLTWQNGMWWIRTEHDSEDTGKTVSYLSAYYCPICGKEIDK